MVVVGHAHVVREKERNATILKGVDRLRNGCGFLKKRTAPGIAPTRSSVTSKTWSRSPPIAPRATDEHPAVRRAGVAALHDGHGVVQLLRRRPAQQAT